MALIAWIAGLFALIGVIQQYLGVLIIQRFCAAPAPVLKEHPPVSLLKPLCGVEPLTRARAGIVFLIEYPVYQLVFGVQNKRDPVLDIVARLRARYPQRDVTVVIDPTLHGTNRKISNLINMYPSASYETLVMSDADIHVPPYFLNRVVSALGETGVGLVTTLYTALPGTPHLATLMGANQINYTFLPGALLARKLGRQDCLGVTMALTKTVLAEVGGLEAVSNHLADDQVLGRLVRAKGYALTLAPVIPATTVPEADFRALFRHELRWARTIRALVPVPSRLRCCRSRCSGPGWRSFSAGFGLGRRADLVRAADALIAARRIDALLRLAKAGDAWLFVVRDFCSAVIYLVSYAGDTVDWRGRTMRAEFRETAPRRRRFEPLRHLNR